MKYRVLGNSGLEVSEIGFGAWGIGGAAGGHAAYGPTDDRESVRALHAALEYGVNFFDTSDLYGMGHSETIIGLAFKGTRNRVLIATKGGMSNSSGDQDFSPAYLHNSLERSLKRLGTDYIDLYQLHSPAIELLGKDHKLLPFLDSLIREGKVRAVGISARSPEEALIAVEQYGVRVVQVNLSLIDRRALENGLLARCRELGAGIVARTPLCFGFLTGRYSVEDIQDPSDHRSCWPKEQVERWSGAACLFGDAIHSGGGQTLGQKALRFCLSFPEVSSVIPGMLTADQVAENTKASELGSLTLDELAEVEQIYKGNIFFAGR